MSTYMTVCATTAIKVSEGIHHPVVSPSHSFCKNVSLVIKKDQDL